MSPSTSLHHTIETGLLFKPGSQTRLAGWETPTQESSYIHVLSVRITDVRATMSSLHVSAGDPDSGPPANY